MKAFLSRCLFIIAIQLCWFGGGEAAELTNAAVAISSNPVPLADKHRLGPGDRITYRVIEDQDEPKSITITDSGDLQVPYYGLVRAAGKTTAELSQEIKRLLEKDLYIRATVIIAVETANTKRVVGHVYVTGQVRNSGGYEIATGENLTVSKALLKAGGFSDFSDKKNVRVIRETNEGRKTFIVNIQEIWEKGQLNKDIEILPDDMIVVPARLVNF